MNTGDTGWVLTSSALVLLMTLPGLAFFYGGLVRRKNVLSVLMQCLIILCVITLQWVLFGYSLTFGPDTGQGIIGGLDWLGLRNVGGQPNADYAATIPHYAFMIFQCMFAVITPALIIGTYAERIKFSAFLAFTVLWATFVYDPLGHWVWGTGGWLKDLGASGFRRRYRRPHEFRCFGSRAGPSHRQEDRYGTAALCPPQPALHGPGRSASLVRLVRVQRGQRPGSQ